MKSLFIAFVATAGLACAASEITSFDNGTNRQNLVGVGSGLIECPTNTTQTASSVVTPLGGLVSVGGMTVNVPAGAVLGNTTITLTVPASRYMEIDVSVASVDHFVFETPITVTVSYARCNRGDIDKSTLSAWHIDTSSKALLEQMPSVDDKLARTVTFTTGHLSGYALAN